MATETARPTRSRRGRRRRAAAELREALERTLEAVDADDRVGPLIGATELRMRFEFTDIDLVLNVAPRPAIATSNGRSPRTRAGRRSSSCG